MECSITIDDGYKNKIRKYHKEKDIIVNNSKNEIIFIVDGELGEDNKEKVKENLNENRNVSLLIIKNLESISDINRRQSLYDNNKIKIK